MSELAHLPEQRTLAAVVAANIRAEMARWRLTQRDVARIVGLPPSAVSDRSRGRTPWTLGEIEIVARHLRTTASELCAIRDSNPEPADYCHGLADVVELGAWRAAA